MRFGRGFSSSHIRFELPLMIFNATPSASAAQMTGASRAESPGCPPKMSLVWIDHPQPCCPAFGRASNERAPRFIAGALSLRSQVSCEP